jgi:hypothetical protein
MSDQPLIWTIKGNLPLDSLRYEHQWEDTPDETTFSERWFTQDGELVKNNCHKLAKRQLTIGGEQAAMA